MKHLPAIHRDAPPYTARCGVKLGRMDDVVQPHKVNKLVPGGGKRPSTFIRVRQFEEETTCPYCFKMRAEGQASYPGAAECRAALLSSLNNERRGPSGRMYSPAPPANLAARRIGRV